MDSSSNQIEDTVTAGEDALYSSVFNSIFRSGAELMRSLLILLAAQKVNTAGKINTTSKIG
jgi:hypothetical protein